MKSMWNRNLCSNTVPQLSEEPWPVKAEVDTRVDQIFDLFLDAFQGANRLVPLASHIVYNRHNLTGPLKCFRILVGSCVMQYMVVTSMQFAVTSVSLMESFFSQRTIRRISSVFL